MLIHENGLLWRSILHRKPSHDIGNIHPSLNLKWRRFMGLPQAKIQFDLESYLTWEAGQSEKNEYHRGEVFAMVGARLPHNIVAGNIFSALKQTLRGTPCRTFIDGTKLYIESADAVLYPDVMVSCDARDRGPEDRFLTHPTVVVEVLSESTAAYDRGAKFALYRKLDSLRDYLLIDPEFRRVELFSRTQDGAYRGQWMFRDFTETDRVEIASVGASLLITEIFEDIQ